MDSPKVSIIIPSYNHKDYLPKRFDSVFNQTFQDFEVIILDDASTDGSQEFLKQYANHPKVSHFVLNDANSGNTFKQWKKGVELADGEYIWIAESDDYCEPIFLESLTTIINDFDLGYVQTINVDEKDNKLENRLVFTNNFHPNIWEGNFCLEGQKFIEKYLIEKNVIPNASAVLFKRNLIKKENFCDDLLSMKMCGDWWFWLKFLRNAKMIFLSENLNYQRCHREMTRNHKGTDIKMLRLLEESKIRSEIYKQGNVRNKRKEMELYSNWFKIKKAKDIFRSEFYLVKLNHTTMFQFLFYYISLKLNTKFRIWS